MCEKVLFVRNFLYKFFVIGFLLLIISAILYIFLKDFAAGIAQSWYKIEPVFYYNFAFVLLAYIKVILFFFILTPALALHWMLSCCRKKEQK